MLKVSTNRGVNYCETFSLIVKPAAVRAVLSVTVMNQWQIRQVDVNNTFLNGDLTKEFYMNQPKTFVDQQGLNFICKLLEALYVLRQAHRVWYDKLKDVIHKGGFKNCRPDTFLFLRRSKTSVILVLTYIDDIFITRPNCAKLESFVKQFSSIFASKDLDKLSYFLGIEVLYYQGSIYFFHKKYIRGLLVKVNMLECKGVNTSMSSSKDSKNY